MSRHGYGDGECDDQESFWMWIRHCGAVKRALNGPRGQRLLREMVAALDAMPVKRLVTGALQRDGEVCALGAVGRARGLDMSGIDFDEDEDEWDTRLAQATAQLFDIPPTLAREIAYHNDELYGPTPEMRWQRMRSWAAHRIILAPDELIPTQETARDEEGL